MNLIDNPSTRFLMMSTTGLLTCAPLCAAVAMPATPPETLLCDPPAHDLKMAEARPGVFRLEA